MRKHTILSTCITALFLLLFSAAVSARESGENPLLEKVDPFLNDSLFMLAHLDISKVDIKELCSESFESIESVLLLLEIDEKSIRGINREAKKILKKGENRLLEYQQSLAGRFGITEVFLAVYGKDDSKSGVEVFLLFPTENRTKKQRENFALWMKERSEQWGAAFYETRGMQILGDLDEFEEDSGWECFQREKTIQYDLSPLFSPENDSSFRVVCFLSEQWTETLIAILTLENNPGVFSVVPPKDKERKEKLAEKFRSLFARPRCLFFEADFQNMEMQYTVQNFSDSDLQQVRKIWSEIVDLCGESILEQFDQGGEMGFLAPMFSEFFKGLYRTYLPGEENLQMQKVVDLKPGGTFAINILIGAAHFLLPPLDEKE